MVYLALIHSVSEYGAPAWFPWTSKLTYVDQLETALLALARAIANLVGTTPKAVIQIESDLPSLRELTLLQADKWK